MRQASLHSIVTLHYIPKHDNIPEHECDTHTHRYMVIHLTINGTPFYKLNFTPLHLLSNVFILMDCILA